MDGRTSDTSESVQCQNKFRKAVVRRDRSCVLSGELAIDSTACRLLPHSKGNNYISNFMEHRGGPDDINSIDDPRNGLLLFTSFHGPLGRADVAFLKTPNFGLTVNDIPSNPPRTSDQGSPISRLTLQHFGSKIGVVVSQFAPHNRDARPPERPGERPPNVILDSVYASVALEAWGPQSFFAYAGEKMKETYYKSAEDDSEGDAEDEADNVEGDAGGNEYDGEDNEASEASTSAQPTHGHNLRHRNTVRPAPRAGRRAERRLGDMLDVVLGLWMHTAKHIQPKPESPAASNVARSEDIKTWLQSVEESRDHA
ncbi:hypothetical protein BS47DRAFT_1335225 [Hydnum rufescens UP504]|uniref:HNH nuclease domain-containing protein n=1 Tax=Hydnum rufescens UP504 TaxID=1448309 RepID=A0A9P6E2S7_9AGAM|nr:hypothetical protein BS47DRAFT_1335225 [Hydnum rufescens UP504]